MRVSVRSLKVRLREYLRRVQHGECVTVTVHGRPIATLVPVDTRRAQLEASGEVSAPSTTTFGKVRRSKIKGRSASSSLLSDRG